MSEDPVENIAHLREPATLEILLDFIPNLEDKWIRLATYLGEKDSIKAIEKQNKDMTDILYIILDNWISAGERKVGGVLVKPTWEYLLNVLRKPVINKGDVADEITKRLEVYSQSNSHHMEKTVERNTRFSSLKEESNRQSIPGGVTEVKGETLYSEYQHVIIEQHHLEILQSCIVDEVPHKWEEIGTALGVSVNKLGGIKSSAKEYEQCLLKLFSEWIRKAHGTGNKPRTFGSLLDVLVDRSCQPEADALKEQLLKKGLIQKSAVTLQRYPLHEYHEKRSLKETKEFLKGKAFSDHLVSFCNMKGLHTHLCVSGIISEEQMQEMSRCVTTKDANSKLFEYLVDDPSSNKLQKLCDVLKEHTPSHENNQELVKMIKEFIQ